MRHELIFRGSGTRELPGAVFVDGGVPNNI